MLDFNPNLYLDESRLFRNPPEWLPIDLSTLPTQALDKYDLSKCELTLVCGTSTAGKTTLINKALSLAPDVHFLPRATSRPPRPGEQDGIDYFFSIENPLLWSTYGGYEYAITEPVIERLNQIKKAVMIQGLVYALVLKELLQPRGVKVKIIYVLPSLISEGYECTLEIIARRLPLRHGATQQLRLNSIRAELQFVFKNYTSLIEKGLIFLENTPVKTGINLKAVAKLVALL
ncbi:MAG TPA: hypothetical protein VD999_01785 [Vitreimonas sp.]|nr:hypothetical protein [Vitreimonas sp.]